MNRSYLVVAALLFCIGCTMHSQGIFLPAEGCYENCIAGTSPGNLWVVGNNGKLLHWPR